MTQDIKEAFTALGPLDLDELPAEGELAAYLRTMFSHAELVLNSLPTCFSNDASKPDILASPNTATTAQDTFLDPATIPASYNPRQTTAELETLWGKPLKVSAKDNPLGVGIWKQASHDRQSAWFARRSVHQGLGFERWKRCLQREFLTSLRVKGGPGAGAVRGIAADRRLQKMSVPGVGTIEVWQLSSAFPGPTTSREFVTAMISSEHGLTEASAPKDHEKPPRSFISISRPSMHPDAPDRAGYVKGMYESAELIREVPLFPDNPEMNPVEWLMITRSDPGGGIPKFLVERGTPGSIVADVPKWLKWAIQQGDIPPFSEQETDKEVEDQNAKSDVTESQELQSRDHHRQSSIGSQIKDKASAAIPGSTSNKVSSRSSTDGQAARSSNSGADSNYGGPLGYLASIRDTVSETVSAYLPHFAQGRLEEVPSDDSSDISDASSFRTFGTAVDEPQLGSQNGLRGHRPPSELSKSTQDLLRAETPSTSEKVETLVQELESRSTRPSDSSEKDFLKLAEKRRQLDARLSASKVAAGEHAKAVREIENSPELNTSETVKKSAKDEVAKAEKQTKEFEKQEARYRSELSKLEEKREKLAVKIYERRHKASEKDEFKRLKIQRDDWKDRAKVMERENHILRRQVEGLQRDNTILVAHVGDEGLVRKILRDAGSQEGSLRGSAASSIKSLGEAERV